MDQRSRQRLRLWAILAAVGAAVGVAYMPVITEYRTPGIALSFAAQGAILVSLVFGFEIFVAQGAASESLRRTPFAVVLAVKTLATTLLIVIGYGIGGLILFTDRFDQPHPLLDLLRDTAFALGVSLLLQFILMVRDIVGGRVLANLIVGRYHRPLREARIFMFLDVRDSTLLAESLGGEGAYEMISRFFFDVAQETVRFGGETHEYIGDAVVVTWPLGDAVANACCLQCYFAICDRLAARAGRYRRDFGLVPGFRAGLHGGSIVAGECGDDKREIVYFGDTINTAARIQEACKSHDRPLLVSGELLHRIDLPPGWAATSLGPVRLRGRESEIELFAVDRGTDDAARSATYPA